MDLHTLHIGYTYVPRFGPTKIDHITDRPYIQSIIHVLIKTPLWTMRELTIQPMTIHLICSVLENYRII